MSHLSTSNSRKWFLKLGSFVFLVTAGQWLVFTLFGSPPVKGVHRVSRAITEPYSTLLLGDSTVSNVEEDDEDQSSLAQMIQRGLVGTTIDLSHPAWHPRLFVEQVRYTARRARQPTLVVLPINLRVFSVFWDQRPEYQFENQRQPMVLAQNPWVEPFLLPLKVFKAFPPKSTDRAHYLSLPVDYLGKSIGTVEEIADRSGLQWRVYYGYALKDSHRQLRALKRLFQEVAAHPHMNLVPYITPIPLQKAVEIGGEALGAQIQSNVEKILQVGEDTGIPIFNLVNLVATSQFGTLEHLRERGRKQVANQVLAAVPSEFRAATRPETFRALNSEGRGNQPER